MAVKTLEERYNAISEFWTKNIEGLSSSVSTYRIKLGNALLDLDDRVNNLTDSPKAKREFKKAKLDDTE